VKGLKMAVRTYRPGLKLAAEAIKKYIQRYQLKLQQSLGEEGYTLLIAVLDAVILLLEFLDATADAPEH
jgi:hypothetical protein